MDGIRGKVTIVTGGATLIGAEVVRAFHGAGSKVVVADINEKGGLALAGQLGSNVLFVRTDLAEDGQISACVEKTVKAFGGIDFLVNLACVYIDNALESTREEWLASYNINVNAIVPGIFRTPLNAELLDLPERGGRLLSRVPMGRFGDVSELAGTAIYLASDASRYVTGTIVSVDGGYLANGM